MRESRSIAITASNPGISRPGPRLSGLLIRAVRAGILGLALGPATWAATDFETSVARIEARMGGRIGVCAVKGSQRLGHRAEERFAYCSTFKWVLGAGILKKVDEGKLDLARKVSYTQKDLMSNSPITSAHVREGSMGIGDLCAATIETSDNAAANLLEPLLGGTAGMQSFVRSLGDTVMRFDRLEPELNTNLPGDPRDTTTPEGMTHLLKTVIETDALSKGSRDLLQGWMKAAVTGKDRIRASVPQGWTVEDKTGTGSHGAANDVAVLLPPQGAPVYISIFTDGDQTDTKAHERAIADVTKAVLDALR